MPPNNEDGLLHTHRLARARTLSHDLGAATTVLTKALADAEGAIRLLDLGVSAGICVARDDGRPDDAIAFGKHNGDWRLLYKVFDTNGGVEAVVPLLNASRRIRLYAALHLDELVQALLAVAEEQLAGVRAGTDDVARFVDALKART